MPFSGTGKFNRQFSWIADAAAGLKISSTRMDGDANDFAAGLSICLTRDGQSSPTAPINWGGQNLTNVALLGSSTMAVSGTATFAGTLAFGGTGVADFSAGTLKLSPTQPVVGVPTFAATAPVNIPYASSITPDQNVGINFACTLTGNVTVNAPANLKPGTSFCLALAQDSTGSRVPTLASIYDFGGAGAPIWSTAAGKADKVFCYVDSATHITAFAAIGFSG